MLDYNVIFHVKKLLRMLTVVESRLVLGARGYKKTGGTSDPRPQGGSKFFSPTSHSKSNDVSAVYSI